MNTDDYIELKEGDNITQQKKQKKNSLKLTGFGATGFVGRSALMLHDNDRKVLLDCGLELRPKQTPLEPAGVLDHARDLDAIILSHAHIDHSGFIPRLYQEGYRGPTYLTPPTRDITLRLWEDTFKINPDVHWEYDWMEYAYDHTVAKPYKKKFKVTDGVTAEFYNAGHVLGAASVLVEWDGARILYSGDINDRRTPFFNGFELPEEDVDVVIMESTNGVRKVPDRGQINVDLKKAIDRTLAKKGKFILPTFAVGRSQEMLFVLADMMDRDIPVYMDGMINDMNEITNRYLTPQYVDSHALDMFAEFGGSPLKADNFNPISRTTVDSPYHARREIMQSDEPSIIVTTSGMLEGGPVHSYLEFGAGDPNNTMAITGYQVEGTLGRTILEGARKIRVNDYRWDGGTVVNMKLRVMRFPYSGHASLDGLKMFATRNNAKQVILVHGEESSQNALIQKIANGIVPEALKFQQPLELNI